MLRDFAVALPWALLISAVIGYAIIAPTLGADPRGWGREIHRQQVAAVRDEYTRVCTRQGKQ